MRSGNADFFSGSPWVDRREAGIEDFTFRSVPPADTPIQRKVSMNPMMNPTWANPGVKTVSGPREFVHGLPDHGSVR